ncbi:hypothetical protein RBI13_18110 [Alcaligenaceae bacterium A4P071]|nr:hypothetical protein [Alcaligenaceae bacterium B3P038]MDQ2187103.1 hypothetical protein [Alcaligenaceae bacterium A4P071]
MHKTLQKLAPRGRWPFVSNEVHLMHTGALEALVPSLVPATAPAASPARPSVHKIPSVAVMKAIDRNSIAGVGIHGAMAQPVTRARMIKDVMLVAGWGAVIPGVMWIGSAVGY